MKKDKNSEKEMSDKKRLQGLVWDGLFNSLEDKAVENKNSNTSKKAKKDKKAENIKNKPEENQTAE